MEPQRLTDQPGPIRLADLTHLRRVAGQPSYVKHLGRAPLSPSGRRGVPVPGIQAPGLLALKSALELHTQFAEPRFNEPTRLTHRVGDLIVLSAEMGEHAVTGIV
jgi:hypothetical protein